MKAILARITGFAAKARAMASVAAVVAPVVVGAAMFESASAQQAGDCLTLSADMAGNTCNRDIHVRHENGDGAQLTIFAMMSVAVTDPHAGGLAACFVPSYPENVMFPAEANIAPTWMCAGVPASGGGSDKTTSTEHFAMGVGIIILAGAAFNAWDDDGSSAFSMTPTSRHSYEDGLLRTRHGTRLDYHGDEWSLWWSAETENTFGGDAGSLGYSSFGWGGAWRGDAVYMDAAALISDNGADLRAGAGADLDLYGWALRPSWRVHAEALDSGRWDSRMDAALAAEWARLGWKVSPSLGATGSLRDAAENEAFMRLRVERTLGW